jgi:hypothetical protein
MLLAEARILLVTKVCDSEVFTISTHANRVLGFPCLHVGKIGRKLSTKFSARTKEDKHILQAIPKVDAHRWKWFKSAVDLTKY